MVTYMERYATGVQDGCRNGAGIGIQDMKWTKPVRPGHTLTYTYEIIQKLDLVVQKNGPLSKAKMKPLIRKMSAFSVLI